MSSGNLMIGAGAMFILSGGILIASGQNTGAAFIAIGGAFIAIVLVVVAWKLLKGLIKTVALVGILAIAAYYVFRTGGFG